MKSSQVCFYCRLFCIVLAAPLLAFFLAGCKTDGSFFAPDYNGDASLPGTAPVVSSAPPMAASPFADYDRTFIGAISNQWLKAVSALPSKPPVGNVVLGFQLNLNGTINDLQVVQSTMADQYNQLCLKAVTDAAPFETWSDELRSACTNGYRDIEYQFDFK